MMFRAMIVTTFLLIALNTVIAAADVVEESENRVLKSLKVVVTAVDVSEEAAKAGLSVEVVSKEVAKVLKTSKIDEAQPEKGMARPVFIVKLYLGSEYKKANDINDSPEAVTEEEPAAKDKVVSPDAAKPGAIAEKTKKKSKSVKGPKTEDRLAGYLQIRIADLAKIERLGDKPVSVNSFERIYPFQARPRSKVKQAVIDTLIGKTFKRDFRGAVKESRASAVP